MSSINYRLSSQIEIDIAKFKKIITANSFYHYPETGHVKGKYYATDLKAEKIKLIFLNNTEKNLRYIVFEN